MNDEGQAPASRAHSESVEDSHDRFAERPTVHVAPSGSLYVELDDLVPYFLPTEEEVRSYIEENREEVQGYIKETNARYGKVPPTD
jgi:hypothetical protein